MIICSNMKEITLTITHSEKISLAAHVGCRVRTIVSHVAFFSWSSRPQQDRRGERILAPSMPLLFYLPTKYRNTLVTLDLARGFDFPRDGSLGVMPTTSFTLPLDVLSCNIVENWFVFYQLIQLTYRSRKALQR